MSGFRCLRTSSQSLAGLAVKGWIAPKEVERWQDKSRDVRTSFGGGKASKISRLRRGVEVAGTLRFSPGACSASGISTSRRVDAR
jgi:hypothetical protein